MAENRSLRVTLSVDVSSYVTGVQRAAKATREIAVAAKEVHTAVDKIGSGAGLTTLARNLTDIDRAVRGIDSRNLVTLAGGIRTLAGSGSGLTSAVSDIRKFAAAISSIRPESAAGMRDVATALHGVGSLGGGLTTAAEDIRRFATALRTIDANTATRMRDIGLALHGIGSIGLTGAADELKRVATAIRSLVASSSSIPALRALATALRDLGAAGGGLGNLGNAGNALRGMQGQIDQLRRSIRGMRSDGGGSGGSGSGGIFGSIFGGAALGNVASNLAMSAFSKITSGIRSTVTATADYETQIKTFGAVTKASGDQMAQASKLAIQLGGDVTIAGANAADAAQVLTELAKGGMSVASSFAAAKGTLQLASAATVSVGAAAKIETNALNVFSLGAGNATKVADILANTAAASAGEITDYAAAMTYTGVQAHSLGMTLTDTSAALGVLGQNGELGSIAGTNLNDMLLRLNPQTKKTKDAMHELGVVGFDATGKFVGLTPVIDQLSAAHKRLSPAAFESATKMAFGVQGMRAAGIFAEKGAGAYTDMSKAITGGAGAAAFSTAKMSGLGGAILNVKNQLETAQVTLGEKFSPALQTALNGLSAFIPKLTGFMTGSGLGGGLSSIGKWFSPLVDGAKALVETAWPYVEKFGQQLGTVWSGIVAGVKPVADAIGGLFKSIASDGTMSNFGNVLTTIGSALSTVAGWLKPIGTVIAGVIGWISGLPAPVKDAAIAFGIMKLAIGPMGSIFKAVRQEIVMATYGMGALGFAGRSVGASMALVGTSIKTAFGGWIGLGITAAVTALTFFMSGTKDATQATTDFSDAIDTNTGKLNDNSAATIAAKVKDAENAYIAAGGAVGDYTSAVMGLAPAQARVMATFTSLDLKAVSGTTTWAKYGKAFGELGITAQDVATAYATGGDAVGALQEKFRAGTTVLNKYGIGMQDTNGIFQAFGSITDGTSQKVSKYHSDVSSLSGAQKSAADTAKNAAAAVAATSVAATVGSGGVKDLKTNTGDMTIALEAASIAAGNAAPAYDGLGAAIAGAKINTDSFFTLVASKTKGDPATVITPMSTAFDAYNTSVSAADTTTQMFMMTMDKLAGRDVSVEDAISANAAAARGLGAAQRQGIQNLLDQKKAVADLATAQADLNKNSMVDKKDASGKTVTNKDGSAVQVYSDTAHAAAVAAITSAQLQLADANDKVAGTQDALNVADTAYKKSAVLRIVQVAEQANKMGGFGKAVSAATVEMQKQRDAFIAQQPAAEIASGAAGKLADKYGLIPKNVTTIISGDTKLAQGAAAFAQQTATAVAVRKYELQLTADSFPAVTKATDLGKLTDLATRLRTLKIEGVDNASPKVQALNSQIAALQQAAAKPIVLTVDATGAVGSMAIKADGSFTTSSGGKGFATGGYVTGPGGPREDKIPAMLSNGEFVVNAVSTSKFLPQLHAMNKYADGGLVGPSNVTLNETGNINPALAHVTGIIDNARKSAAAINAAAAAQAASMSALGSTAGTGGQDPSAFGWTVGKNIVPFSFHGIPFPAGVAGGTQSVWTSFLSELEPIIKGGIRPGEDWGFENRDNVNSPGQKSFHSYGLALDVNAPENGNGTPPGNGIGQVPPGAGALAHKYNMQWGGEWTGTKDPMHFELHQRPGGSAVAGAVGAAASAIGVITNLAGSGVERWRALALQVAAAKGENPASVQVMLNQMSRESSGNPAAQNNTDINAQRGDPSKGLLQFISGTFAANADPGFDKNIWDPASQMHAWYNYINRTYGGYLAFSKRGYGAYADGGLVSGPGTGRSDSIQARVSNGEYIVNAASTAANLPLLHAINGYARGGLVTPPPSGIVRKKHPPPTTGHAKIVGGHTVTTHTTSSHGSTVPHHAATHTTAHTVSVPVLTGNASALAGYPSVTMGTMEAGVVAALQAIAAQVAQARANVQPAKDAESARWDALQHVKDAAKSSIAVAQARLAIAEKAARGNASAQGASAAAALSSQATRSAASVASAEARLAAAQAAPHVGQWGKALASAEAGLRKAQAASAAAQTALERRVAAISSSKSASATAKIELAQLQLTKTAALSQASVRHAQQQYDAALKTRKAYEVSAAAAEAFQRSQQRNFQAQQANAAQMDMLTQRLADQSAKLTQMRTDRATMASGLASTVSGFDGGIIGHPDTRTTFDTILKGQQYDAAKAQAFSVNVSELSKLGLSNGSINSIASAGIDGGGVTAAALAKATPAQIKQLNHLTAQMGAIGDHVGGVVASQFYDAGIASAAGYEKGLKSKINSIQKVMSDYATAAVNALNKKLQIHSPSRVTHLAGVHTATGFTNGVLSGHAGAHAAMAGLAQAPQPFIPAQSYSRAQAPNIVISVSGSDNLSHAVASMITVEVDGFATDLGHSLRKAEMQR